MENILKKTKICIIFIVLIIFLVRIPTFFIEFLNVDELSEFLLTKEGLLGGIMFQDVLQVRFISYLYHYFALYILGDGSTIGLHVLTSFIYVLCALGLFYIGILIKNRYIGFYSAIIYISNCILTYPENTACMLESIVNLFIIHSILIILYLEVNNIEKIKKYILLFIVGILIFLASLSKQTGIIYIILPCIYFIYKIIVYKYKYFLDLLTVILGFFISILILLIYLYINDNVYNFVHYFFLTSFYQYLPLNQGYIWYETVIRFLESMFYIFIAQPILWISSIFILFKFIKAKAILDINKDYIGLLLIWFIISYFLFFAGGQNLFLHYLIYSFPVSSVLGGIFIYEILNKTIKNKLKYLKLLVRVIIFLPLIFFTIYYYYLILNVNHDYCSSNYINKKNYVIPKDNIKKVICYIKNNSNGNDRLFVWGEEVSIYYFTTKRISAPYLWCKYLGYYNYNEKYKNKIQYFLYLDYQRLMENLNRKKPLYFVDCSTSDKCNFSYAKISKFPILYDFIKNNYKKVNTNNSTFDGIDLYMLKE